MNKIPEEIYIQQFEDPKKEGFQVNKDVTRCQDQMLSIPKVTYDLFELLAEKLNAFKHKNDHGFYRQITFVDAYNNEIKLEYWDNICYAYISNITICFKYANINGYWPNQAKVNLNLSNDGRNKIAIIPLELYPEQGDQP